MSRLNTGRQITLEPKRVQSTKEQIEALGYEITMPNDKELNFTLKGHTVKFFPYSGWHTGKTIKDGRGFSKLIKQITHGDNNPNTKQ